MAKWVRHPANWKGGRVNDGGYHCTYIPNHPRASHNGYVKTHILIAEKALGMPLPQNAQVHHVNQIRSDNRTDNLVICEDDAYHKLLHQRSRSLINSGSPTAVKCRYCKQWDEVGVNGMYVPKIPSQAYHKSCSAESFRKGGKYGR